MVDLSLAHDLSGLAKKPTPSSSDTLQPPLEDILDSLPSTPSAWGEASLDLINAIHLAKHPLATGFLKDKRGYVYKVLLELVGADETNGALDDYSTTDLP